MLRSSLYHLFQTLLTLLFGSMALFLWPVPRAPRYHIMHWWARWNLFALVHLCKIKYDLIYEDGPLDGRQSYVFASVHQSDWEAFIFHKIIHWPTFVLKRELMWIPFFGIGMLACWPIIVNRELNKRSLKHLISEGTKRLQGGASVVIFPQGSRTPAHAPLRFKAGAALLSVESGFPVVPVAHNAGACWPRHSFRKRAGTVKVVIGKAVNPERMSARQLNDKLERWVKATMERINNNEY